MLKKGIIAVLVLAVVVITTVWIIQENNQPIMGGPDGYTQFSVSTDTLEVSYQGAVKIYKNDDRKGVFDIVEKLDYYGEVDNISLDELVKNAYISIDFKNSIKAYIVNKEHRIYISDGDKIVQYAAITDKQIEYFEKLFEE